MAKLNIGSIYSQLGINVNSFGKNLDKAGALVRKFSTTVGNASRQAVIAFAAVGTASALAAKDAFAFEKQMSRVNTIINTNKSTLKRYSKDVLSITEDYGKLSSEGTDALYNITSAGVAAEDSTYALKKATQSATAGFVDINTAANAGTLIMNQYAMSIDDLNRIYDLQFATVKKGVMTYKQLGDSLGMIIPSSAKLGVSLEETMGAFAFLSRGMNPAAAAVALARSFDGLADKAENLSKIGVEVFDSFGKFRGYENIINDLSKAMAGLSDKAKNALLAEIGFEIRAGRAIIPATKNTEKFKNMLGEVRNSTGLFEEALVNATDNVDFQLQKLIKKMTNLPKKMLIGSTTIKKGLKEINDILDKIDFEEVFGSERFKEITEMAVGIGGVTAAIALAGASIALISNPLVQLVTVSGFVAGAMETNFLKLGTVFNWIKKELKNLLSFSLSIGDILDRQKLDAQNKSLMEFQKIMDRVGVLGTTKMTNLSGMFEKYGVEGIEPIISLVKQTEKEFRRLGFGANISEKFTKEMRETGRVSESTMKEIQLLMQKSFSRIAGDYSVLIDSMEEKNDKPVKSLIKNFGEIEKELNDLGVNTDFFGTMKAGFVGFADPVVKEVDKIYKSIISGNDSLLKSLQKTTVATRPSGAGQGYADFRTMYGSSGTGGYSRAGYSDSRSGMPIPSSGNKVFEALMKGAVTEGNEAQLAIDSFTNNLSTMGSSLTELGGYIGGEFVTNVLQALGSISNQASNMQSILDSMGLAGAGGKIGQALGGIVPGLGLVTAVAGIGKTIYDLFKGEDNQKEKLQEEQVEELKKLNRNFDDIPTGIKLASSIFEARGSYGSGGGNMNNGTNIIIHINGNASPMSVRNSAEQGVNAALSRNNLSKNGSNFGGR